MGGGGRDVEDKQDCAGGFSEFGARRDWFRTDEFQRSDGLTLLYGDDLRNVGLELALLAGNDRHVVLCASDGRKVNVAALTLGNTRMGVDELRLMVAKLNAVFAAP